MSVPSRLLALLLIALPAPLVAAQEQAPPQRPARPQAGAAQAEPSPERLAAAQRYRQQKAAEVARRGQPRSLARSVDGGGRMTPKQVRERLERVRAYRERMAAMEAARQRGNRDEQASRAPAGGRPALPPPRGRSAEGRRDGDAGQRRQQAPPAPRSRPQAPPQRPASRPPGRDGGRGGR